ncbi:NAD_binding_1 domain-containing protein [Durusdinium trenchii]|uniref:NAD_binding_1 domain-containing protein n=1 Tax=Durusdinium trenchii TaxID=1381693 RepID=A0ABP0KVD0_9DINO
MAPAAQGTDELSPPVPKKLRFSAVSQAADEAMPSSNEEAEEETEQVETYPGWQSTRKFTIGVRSDVLAKSNSGNFSFDTATQIVEEIGERYGHWQDAECRDLKRLLSKYENAGTGRVLLKDFYGAALDGNWQFSESVEYLQELGALDQCGAPGE